MNVLIVGQGKWGTVLKREVEALGHSTRFHERRHGLIPVSGIDAAVFAVPPDAQASLAPAFLRVGIHCFLEKPLALSVKAAEKVFDAYLAAPNGTITMCDHLRTMAGSWCEFSRGLVVKEGSRLVSVDAAVVGPGPDRAWDVPHPYLWDYGPHALAYVFDLLRDDDEAEIDDVAVAEIDDITVTVEDARMAILFRLEGIACGVRVSNGAPEKISTVNVGFARLATMYGKRYLYDSEKERPLSTTLGVFFNAILNPEGFVPATLSFERGVSIVRALDLIQKKAAHGL